MRITHTAAVQTALHGASGYSRRRIRQGLEQAARAGFDERGACVEVHAARGNQRNFWKRALQRADITRASHLRARKYFHQVRTEFPGRHYFCGREGAGDHQNTFLLSELQRLQIYSRAYEKLRSGVQAALSRVNIEDRAGAD